MVGRTSAHELLERVRLLRRLALALAPQLPLEGGLPLDLLHVGHGEGGGGHSVAPANFQQEEGALGAKATTMGL